MRISQISSFILGFCKSSFLSPAEPKEFKKIKARPWRFICCSWTEWWPKIRGNLKKLEKDRPKKKIEMLEMGETVDSHSNAKELKSIMPLIWIKPSDAMFVLDASYTEDRGMKKRLRKKSKFMLEIRVATNRGMSIKQIKAILLRNLRKFWELIF